jgi:hypothetical protein
MEQNSKNAKGGEYFCKAMYILSKNDFPNNNNPVSMEPSEIRLPDGTLINAESHQSK